MRTIRKNCRSGAGAALIIVLAFIVLLAGVMIIFFTQALSYRTQGNSSFNDFKSAALAQSGLETVVGDLRQEIYAGSTIVSYGTGTNVYYPTGNTNAVPQRSGNPALVGGIDPTPNLVRISVRTETYPPGSPGVSSRASADSSTNAAATGQYISLPRWNKHYLLPRSLAGSPIIDTTPTNAFSAPDWVYVTSVGPTNLGTGSAIIAAGTPKVIGRYAYAIYDEGGLLDANVVGVPSNMATNSTSDPAPNTSQVVWGSGLKGSEAFADLTVTNAITQAPMLTQAQINQIVGWRNNATAQPTGNYASGYTFSSANAAAYHDAMVTSTNGFLTTSGTNYTDPVTRMIDTDQVFPSRQSLIAFFNEANPPLPQDSLQYLGTFTRDLEQPSYNPPVGRPMVQSGATVNATTFGTGNDAFGADRASTTTNSPADINPPLLAVRVATAFTRTFGDGKLAPVGDPLIKERFPLSRLSLFPTNEAAPSPAAANLIFQYFGLTYQGAAGTSPAIWLYNQDGSSTENIDRLNAVASQSREANFFELLKAAINVGSVGKGCAYDTIAGQTTYTLGGNVGNLTQTHDTLTALQILQIGANIIDQSKADNFPTRIQFAGDPTSPPNVVCGSEDLPYIYRLRNWITQYGATLATSQLAYLIQPELWDPYSYNSTSTPGLGSAGFIAKTSTPTNFRIRVQPDPSLTAKATPISFTVDYQDGTETSPSVSLNFPNYQSSTSTSPNPVPLTFSAGELNGFWGFREPTLLSAPKLCPAANLNGGNPNAFSQTDLNNGTLLTGFEVCSFPWINTAVSASDNAAKLFVQANSDPASLRCYLEYQDPNNTSNYIVYDQEAFEYQGGSGSSVPSTAVNAIGIAANNTYAKALASSNYDFYGWARVDPRSCRWGATYGQYFFSLPSIGSTDVVFGSQRSDGGISFATHNGGVDDKGFVVGSSGYGAQYLGFQQGYWAENSVRSTYQNSSEDTRESSPYYRYDRDPDGVPRRAIGGYVTDTVNGGQAPSVSQPLTGLPMAIASTTYGSVNNTLAVTTTPSVSPAYGSRPTILHRPFRSVAELGYAFRDTPWGSINFTFPESGDSPLLDVFCVNDTSSTAGLVAGRVDLNTRQAPVISALISGSLLDKDNAATPVLSQVMASDIANQLVARTSNPNAVARYGPLMSRADLVGSWTGGTTPITTSPTTAASALKSAVPPDPNTFYTGFSYDIGSTNIVTGANTSVTGTSVALIPRQRNAVMRALVDSGTTRTWNLLIDLVAQSGRFPPKSTGFSNFVVEGEKHYWLHVAIDRYTGKVIASQLEVVRE